MFYLLNKPKNITSFKFIKQFARENNIKKIGHTGTLDPLATGALLVATDDDTKLIEYIDKGKKTYEAEIIFGKKSNTYDITGEIEDVPCATISLEQFSTMSRKFIGKKNQIPPIFSAKKINGQRAYSLARKNIDVKLKPNKIEIYEIDNIKVIDKNIFSFIVTVSRGTYIRSLIHDIGIAFNSHALMSNLKRTRIGEIKLSSTNKEIDIKDLLTMKIIKVDNIDKLMNGIHQKINHEDGEYALQYNNNIVGIVKINNNIMRSKKLFGNKIKRLHY